MTANTLTEPPLQKVLTDLFHDFEGDETGGRHAIKGFSFQVWLAVLEALRAHRNPGDYAVVLEWQQDIALLNSSTDPTTVRFVQLKKNESALKWTLPSLLKADKPEDEAVNDPAADSHADPATAPAAGKGKTGKKSKPKKVKPSILAKLYVHRRRFSDLAKAGLVFASDASFEVPKAAGGTVMVSSVSLAALPEAAKKDIEAKLRAQLDVPVEEAIDLDDFELTVTDCPAVDPHKFVAGECAELQIATGLELSGKANPEQIDARERANGAVQRQRGISAALVVLVGLLDRFSTYRWPSCFPRLSVIHRIPTSASAARLCRQLGHEQAIAC
ncbi:MAG: DUF4297 domain-containing protein [Burkholderiales bacterium]|nr:DUF4297 domain-containing protein [Burkholderiales bacterium]MBH2017530.1 DUF4297 domain-containing protein [Burkholderiales bacterium]